MPLTDRQRVIRLVKSLIAENREATDEEVRLIQTECKKSFFLSCYINNLFIEGLEYSNFEDEDPEEEPEDFEEEEPEEEPEEDPIGLLTAAELRSTMIPIGQVIPIPKED